MAYHLGVGVAGGILDQRLYGVSMLVSEGGDCGGSRIALLPNLMQLQKFFFNFYKYNSKRNLRERNKKNK